MTIQASLRVLGAGCLMLLNACGAFAITHRVPGEFPTIQAGVSQCARGDTVLVAPGTYTGSGNRNIYVPTGIDLVVISETGPEETIIDCQSNQNFAFEFLRDHTRETAVQGFTIRNSDVMGAIYLDINDSPTIRNCRFDHCRGAYFGSCISCDAVNSAPLIADCVFSDNTQQQGGAVACAEGTAPEITGCVFERNITYSSGTGGAISAWSTAGDVVIRDCVFRDNNGIAVVGGPTNDALIENCEFYRNTGSSGGAVFWSGRVRISGCTITDNSAGTCGGGIVCDSRGVLEIDRSIIWGNCAPVGPDVESWGTIRITCSALPDSGLHTDHGGSIELVGPQVRTDPRFCDGELCAPEGRGRQAGQSYTLRSDSPCLPEFSPCQDQIGALGLGCQAPAPVGACCIQGSGCRLLTAEDCSAQQGDYMGDGESCYPDPCVPIAVESTTWGRIKSVFAR